MRFGSVCSGIEAASVAFEPLAWEAAWFSEIEKFPNRVLAHHYPTVPNHGDMTTLPARILAGEVEAPDVLCGGTPCQAFSIAGLRAGLKDPRGALTLTFCEIANAIDTKRREAGREPSIVVWENVVGALSVAGNAFGCLLGTLAGEDRPLEPAGGKWSNAGCVYGPQRAIAWRVVDAKYFGVPQRRRRLIVVACPLERAHPTQILFECEGGAGHSEPSRAAGQDGTTSAAAGSQEDSGDQPYAVANCLTRRMHKGLNTTLDEGQTPVLAYSTKRHNTQSNQSGKLFGEYVPALDACSPPVAVLAFRVAGDGAAYETEEHTAPVMTNTDRSANCVLAFQEAASGTRTSAEFGTLLSNYGSRSRTGVFSEPTILEGPVVRILMPVEAERLQGFPDLYTDIPGASDTARYKALGNSWAVPVFTWLGRRIQEHAR